MIEIEIQEAVNVRFQLPETLQEAFVQRCTELLADFPDFPRIRDRYLLLLQLLLRGVQVWDDGKWQDATAARQKWQRELRAQETVEMPKGNSRQRAVAALCAVGNHAFEFCLAANACANDDAARTLLRRQLGAMTFYLKDSHYCSPRGRAGQYIYELRKLAVCCQQIWPCTAELASTAANALSAASLKGGSPEEKWARQHEALGQIR
jgi:hypothetical protein